MGMYVPLRVSIWGAFGAGQVEKGGSFGAGQVEKWGSYGTEDGQNQIHLELTMFGGLGNKT